MSGARDIKAIAWEKLAREARSLTESEPDEIANMANVAALLHAALNEARGGAINWTGFYRVASDETLVLGPFQGKVACLRIPFGVGVCGTAAAAQKTVVVPDVDKFPGHIACDCEKRSVCPVWLFSLHCVGQRPARARLWCPCLMTRGDWWRCWTWTAVA